MATLLSSISDRLAELSISVLPASVTGADSNIDNASAAIPLKTYAFKPKGTAESPKIVLVVLEESKDLGKATALAKKVGSGIKDLRAADDEYVNEMLGEGKTTGG